MKKKDLSQFSKEELITELSRRAQSENGNNSSSHSPMYGAEMAIEAAGHELNRSTWGLAA